MINRILIITCILASFVILALNIIPTITNQSVSTYINLYDISGMAVRHEGRLFTLNFDQQKNAIDILNRAIPMGKAEAQEHDPKLEINEIVIYKFQGEPIIIKPIAWVDNSLYFQAPAWSSTNLMEVSKGQLHEILNTSYDRKPYN